MKQVNVLISTYNGEAYIRQQIDSILNQTYKNIKIYVRDDGSKDETISILKEYQNDNKLSLIVGDNVRWGRSFMTLLKLSEEGDYWAFADQDDVWDENKIAWAVEYMDSVDEKTPCLYGCSYELTNESMDEITGVVTPPGYKFDFRRAMTDCLFQGFVIVLNKSLRDIMLRADIENLSSHDWWACILAAKFGVTYFDSRVGAKHRRLDTSMSSMGIKSKLKWFKTTFSSGNSDIGSCAKEYVRVFGEEYKDKDLKRAKWFINDHYSIKNSLCKALYPKRWRPSVVSELSIRLLMLLGRI